MHSLRVPLGDESDAPQPPALHAPLGLQEQHVQSGSAVLIEQRLHRDTGAGQQQLQHRDTGWCALCMQRSDYIQQLQHRILKEGSEQRSVHVLHADLSLHGIGGTEGEEKVAKRWNCVSTIACV